MRTILYSTIFDPYTLCTITDDRNVCIAIANTKSGRQAAHTDATMSIKYFYQNVISLRADKISDRRRWDRILCRRRALIIRDKFM